MSQKLAFLLNIIVFLFILSPQTTFAQSSSPTSSSVVGIVSDPTGAVIVGASITLRNISTNLERTTQVNDQGFYSLTQLPPGEYQVIATASGFSTSTNEKLILSLGTTALLDIRLSIFSENDIIEVIDSTLINQGKTESSTNVDRQTIADLPINRRDFLEFALTSARVTKDANRSQGVLTTSGLSINAQSPRSNNLTVDGLSNNDFASGGRLSPFSQETVQEFQVITNSFSAEIGRTLAGTVNIVTKSGSNELKGNLFSLYRSDDLSARNAFSATNPKFRQYQFGSTLGGAIKENKAFFFASFERLSIKQNNIVTISDETLASIRRQGFSQSNGAIPFSITNTGLLFRSDFIVSNNDTLWIRYNGNSTYNGALEEFGGLIGDTFGGQFRANDYSTALNNTYFNSSGLVNETRFIFSRLNRKTTPISNQPQIQLVAPEGTVNLGQSITLPQQTIQNVYQFVNNTTLSYKNQNIKFGTDILYVKSLPNTFINQFMAGVYSFTPINFRDITGIDGLPSFTGLEAFDPTLRSPQQRAFLNLLSTNPNNIFPNLPPNLPLADLALPRIYVQGFGDSQVSVKGFFFGTFLQDDIKIKPNLLLKLGLRYDINRVSNIPNNAGNFSPRISLSYTPNKINSLTINANYGLFFGLPIGAVGAVADTFKNGFKSLTLFLPFSSIPLQLSEKRFPITNNLPTDVPFIPQLSFRSQIDNKFLNNYSQQANLNISYLLKKNTQLSVEYTFVRGLKLISMRDINPIVRPIPLDPIGSFLRGRIDPTQGTILDIESAYDSYYHALTLSIKRKLQNRAALLASYTYSKAIDNTNDFSLIINEVSNLLEPGEERGLSLQDIRNRLVFSGIFDIGYNKNFLLKDLQLSSIITLESGRPYNLLAGVDLDLSGDANPADRPTAIGRNAGILPGFANIDLRLIKSIKFQEKYNAQLIFEVFNLFNRVNISDINRTFPPDKNGAFNLPAQENGRFIVPAERFRGAFAPRQLQIGLKLSF
ncbi:MAG: carboxypeptidase regulatory-like domain-containing protein [Blastocatellia bacterium]